MRQRRPPYAARQNFPLPETQPLDSAILQGSHTRSAPNDCNLLHSSSSLFELTQRKISRHVSNQCSCHDPELSSGLEGEYYRVTQSKVLLSAKRDSICALCSRNSSSTNNGSHFCSSICPAANLRAKLKQLASPQFLQFVRGRSR